ncbi:MAG TPA: outer membrane beta-barrel protein [Flavitalea sp.]|nr:outer membrane beta-barrel protein [Flavitalea sp.]
MKYFDDDMDELFNKAGSQYPLKSDPKDWDRVRSALLEEIPPADKVQSRKNWKRLFPLLLLLIIPAFYLFLNNIISNKQNNEDTAYNTDKKKNYIADSADESFGNKFTDKNTNNEKSIINSKKSVKAPVLSSSPVTNNQNERINKLSDREVNRLSYVPSAKQSLVKTSGSEGLLNVQGGLSGPPRAGSSKEGVADTKDTKVITGETEVLNQLKSWNKIPLLSMNLRNSNGPSVVIPVKTPVAFLNQSKGSVPKFGRKSNNKTSLYYGVMAAPDITSIKGQAVKGVGYSAGVIIGYTMNDHWQVEGGAMWSRKKYFTDGKYFSKEKAQIPANVKINWLDGGCEMFEFPIAVKYNLSARKNKFFAGAGLTSYIMKKEDYDFSAVYGAGGYDYEGYKMYKRSGDHLFANVQLSAGYKYLLTSKMNIRLEPYLKIPLKKIGIGDMPVTSTGLYFSITRGFR